MRCGRRKGKQAWITISAADQRQVPARRPRHGLDVTRTQDRFWLGELWLPAGDFRLEPVTLLDVAPEPDVGMAVDAEPASALRVGVHAPDFLLRGRDFQKGSVVVRQVPDVQSLRGSPVSKPLEGPKRPWQVSGSWQTNA